MCVEAEPAILDALGSGVRILPPGALPGFEQGSMTDGSFDLVDAAVDELIRRRPALVRQLVRATGSEDVDRYLRRAVLREVGSFLGLVLLVASPELEGFESVVVEERWPYGPDFAFLAELARRVPTLPLPVAAALSRISFGADAVPQASRRLRTAANALTELGTLWRECARLLGPRSRPLPRRPLLIRSYVEDWGLDRGGQPRLRNLDFVVDGEMIAPDDVGVWLEPGVPEDRRGRLEQRGYATLELGDVRVGPLRFLRRFVPALLASTGVFARLAIAERWWAEPVRRLLVQTLVWREVGVRARPRVLLALNDLHPSGIARTLALRRSGCLTVEYEFSSHWLTDERGWVPDYVYGFTVVDAMVTWGPLHSEHLRNHRGSIREFWEVGCLWSEHARLVREDAELGARYRAALAAGHGIAPDDFERVVGIFDTSTAAFFGPDDMVAFYAGVAALAQQLPRVLFLCKPKRPPESVFGRGAGGREVEAALAAAPNVAILDEYFETAAVVGLCDLSVNACFTSPAVETIGVGRPALYYDPTDLFPGSFFRRIPRLVATDERELAALVEQQLFASPEERAADLHERFAELEGRFDGRAITRLRERLRAAVDG